MDRIVYPLICAWLNISVGATDADYFCDLPPEERLKMDCMLRKKQDTTYAA